MKLSDNLVERLTQADVVCRDCGDKYGKYSVGCSSTWEGQCHVCGETKPITEVRDWGYLAKGIALARAQANIKDQSKEVADYMLGVGPIMNDDELEDELTPSYEQGEITCKFTEAEVDVLSTILDVFSEDHPPGKDVVFDSVFEKIRELHDDNCVKYELSPALKAYHEKYGTWGTGEDEARWEGFRDAFMMLEGGK
jgi:hypothetical protein